MRHRLAIRSVLGLAACAVCFHAARPAQALDFEPIQDSTELGVTVTPNQIFDSFEESLTFWPAVRRCVLSGELNGADQAICVEADAYIGQVQDQLHDRLMGADQDKALDVINYVTWNLRRTHFFRQLRNTVANDEATCRLRRAFYRQVGRQMQGGRTVDSDLLVTALEPELKALALGLDTEVRARELLRSIGACQIAIERTETGQLLRQAEEALDGQPCANVVRRIVSAVDWAGVIKDHGSLARREHFVVAWEQLNKPPVELTAGN